jgi:hypothetical protein
VAAVNLDSAPAPAQLTPSAAGGFAGYRPFDTLPPHAAAVIDLGKP